MKTSTSAMDSNSLDASFHQFGVCSLVAIWECAPIFAVFNGNACLQPKMFYGVSIFRVVMPSINWVFIFGVGV